MCRRSGGGIGRSKTGREENQYDTIRLVDMERYMLYEEVEALKPILTESTITS